MVPWLARPVLNIDLAKPMAEQGFPAAAAASARRLLAAIKETIPAKARFLAQLARLRTWNRFQREVVGIAKMADADWRDVMLANLSYDLVLSSLGCSTIALPTRDGPVLARNMDWWPEDLLARASYLLCYQQAGVTRFVNAGWPGGVGVVTGMSQRGFAVALNAVSCPEPFTKTGYPVLLHVRRVIEDARDFDEALAMLRDQRLTAPALFTLVGTDNEQRVVIERNVVLRPVVADEHMVIGHARLGFDHSRLHRAGWREDILVVDEGHPLGRGLAVGRWFRHSNAVALLVCLFAVHKLKNCERCVETLFVGSCHFLWLVTPAAFGKNLF